MLDETTDESGRSPEDIRALSIGWNRDKYQSSHEARSLTGHSSTTVIEKLAHPNTRRNRARKLVCFAPLK